jgi:hypothetical protein
MTGRDDEVDGSDWLTSQFETAPHPVAPADAQPATAAPSGWTLADEPATSPAATPPAAVVPPAVPPGPPPAWGAPAPASAPTTPPPVAAPAPSPTVPFDPLGPATPPPAAPAAPVPPASPAPPAADPPAFSWGLRPGGAPDPIAVDPALAGAPELVEPPAPPLPFETARLAEVAPDAVDAPGFVEPEATQALALPDLEATQAFTMPPRVDPDQPDVQAVGFGLDAGSWGGADGLGFEVAPPMTPHPGAPVPPTEVLGSAAGAEPTSAVDALFGEQNFREVPVGPDPAEIPFARRGARVPDAPAPAAPRPPIPPRQRVLLIVAGSLIGVLVLVVLFMVGTRLPVFTPGSEPLASDAPPPAVPDASVVGPLGPGTYAWDQLLGGECLDPYEGAWADVYTVVDCGDAHTAQLVRRVEFPPPEPADGDAADAEDADAAPVDTAALPYPGADALAVQAAALCSAAGVLDLEAAADITDAQMEQSYPLTAEQWDAGNRFSFCFVSRASGDTITGSLAAAG